jgi:predicted RNA-binding Zn-ribbon protein involved in translation (DUF1610 family)
MLDEDLEREGGDADTCPVCNASMIARCLESKTDTRHDIHWGRYGYECHECGHDGETWEVLSD